MQKGKLYLIPVTLGSNNLEQTLPKSVFEIINEIEHYIVENIKSAVNFLKQAGIKKKIQDLTFYELNVNTNEYNITNYLDAALNGENIGLISEAGVPCVADPGAVIVSLAHQKDVKVVPLVGPSSIILALMASGLNGQNFSFNGYLPIDKNKRKQKIKDLEKKVKSENETQIFIEAPHRNDKLLDEIINNCDDSIKLCIAKNITMEDELITTKKIADWKNRKITIGKNPAIFLLGK